MATGFIKWQSYIFIIMIKDFKTGTLLYSGEASLD